jgi:hypothetical protein
MKLKINFEQKAMYIFLVYIVILFSAFVVASVVPTGESGHVGETILIDVQGTEKTLQEAIETDFSQGGSFSGNVDLTNCEVIELNYTSDIDSNYQTYLSRSWTECSTQKVISGVTTYIFDPHMLQDPPESSVGELMAYNVTCCTLGVV